MIQYLSFSIFKWIQQYRTVSVIKLIRPIDLALTSGKCKVRHFTFYPIGSMVSNYILAFLCAFIVEAIMLQSKSGNQNNVVVGKHSVYFFC
jgi:hypothetical protein